MMEQAASNLAITILGDLQVQFGQKDETIKRRYQSGNMEQLKGCAAAW